jgi:hypothetical protein
MQRQGSFSQAEYAGKKKQTRRDKFLAEMEQVVPWARLVERLRPFYPKGERGRPPLTRLAHARRSSTLIVLSVRSYGQRISSGERRPYFDDRTNQGDPLRSTSSRTDVNHVDMNSSRAGARCALFVLTQDTR